MSKTARAIARDCPSSKWRKSNVLLPKTQMFGGVPDGGQLGSQASGDSDGGDGHMKNDRSDPTTHSCHSEIPWAIGHR